MNATKILLTGSLAYDHLLRYPNKFKDTFDKKSRINASFVLDQKLISLGGCAGNIAYGFTANNFLDFNLVSVLGEKDKNEYISVLLSRNINTEFISVCPNSFSSCAYISTDVGHDQITFFIANQATNPDNKYLNFGNPLDYKLVIIAPHNKNLMLEAYQFASQNKIDYVFDPGQQIGAFNAKEFLEVLSQAKFFILNRQELEYALELHELSQEMVLEMVDYLVVTDSEKPVQVLSSKYNINSLYPAQISSKVVDPTGCGDAFRAGFFSSFVQNKNFDECIKQAMHLASRCLSNKVTQDY